VLISFGILLVFYLYQGRPKGKAAQARALGPPKIFLFYKEFRPQKNSLNFI
jgi:hypothetical protein